MRVHEGIGSLKEFPLVIGVWGLHVVMNDIFFSFFFFFSFCEYLIFLFFFSFLLIIGDLGDIGHLGHSSTTLSNTCYRVEYLVLTTCIVNAALRSLV